MAGQDTHLRILRLADGDLGPLSGYVRVPKSLAFSVDGSMLATSGLDLGVVWTLRDGAARNAEPGLFSHDGSATKDVAFHDSEPRLLMTTHAGGVYVVDASMRSSEQHVALVDSLPSVCTWSGDDVLVGTARGELLRFSIDLAASAATAA